VTIDASKTGASISKYVYGQFLEHIGGIVNNGLWADMLADRVAVTTEKGVDHVVEQLVRAMKG
jgi:alpha-L-arabinofuranosidase